MGISADLQARGLETRIAVLEKKVYNEGIPVTKRGDRIFSL